jgi:hypothetical protein
MSTHKGYGITIAVYYIENNKNSKKQPPWDKIVVADSTGDTE